MPSAEFLALERRINELVTTFVDFDIPLSRVAAQEELDRIAAFKLLVHAELESFIEGKVRSAVGRTRLAWLQDRRLTRCGAMLLLRWRVPGDESFAGGMSVAQIDHALDLCDRRAEKEITDNNGIKQEAFAALACSAGVLREELDSALLAALQSYGAARGDVAHQSVGKVRTLNDPRTEGADARQLVAGLKAFDAAVDLASA